MKQLLSLSAALVFLAVNAFGQGTILWNESVNGQLPNSAAGVFSLGTLGLGTHSVIGSAEAIPNGLGGWGVNNDYFLITVPSGVQVAAARYAVDRASWVWVGDSSFSSQQGFVINPLNGDLLPQWNLGFLTPGVYGLYVSDNDLQAFPTAANYRFDFVVQTIPEPGNVWFVLGGLAYLGFCRRTRTHR